MLARGGAGRSCCEGVTGSRVRGNVFDGVGDGLVVDGAGHGTEVTGNVFLRASGWFIDAPDLAAGGNYWATADASAAAAGCGAGSACCRGSRRARRGTSEDLRRQRVEVAQVERLPRAAARGRPAADRAARPGPTGQRPAGRSLGTGGQQRVHEQLRRDPRSSARRR